MCAAVHVTPMHAPTFPGLIAAARRVGAMPAAARDPHALHPRRCQSRLHDLTTRNPAVLPGGRRRASMAGTSSAACLWRRCGVSCGRVHETHPDHVAQGSALDRIAGGNRRRPRLVARHAASIARLPVARASARGSACATPFLAHRRYARTASTAHHPAIRTPQAGDPRRGPTPRVGGPRSDARFLAVRNGVHELLARASEVPR